MAHIAPKLLLLILFLLLLSVVSPPILVEAQSTAPSPDLACRDCHSGSTREFTFPSGDTTVVGVDLAALDVSPHSVFGTEPVPCTGCHAGNSARYRYPHATNPAESHRDFIFEVSDNCQECHYAHKPFHPIEGTDASELEGEVPICADCHGSHDIARVDAMPDTMPARCLACHTDKDKQWTAEFMEPRPGLGDGAEGYAGSTRCNGCHDDTYHTWHDTLHARLIRNATDDPEAILGDFSLEDSDLSFGPEEIAYTVGSRWRQAYLTWATAPSATLTSTLTTTDTLTNTLTNTLELLPMQWLVDSAEWAPLEEGGQPPRDWIAECGSCHVTGLNTDTWGFTEFGIGCESCHGPAEEHATDPENVKPFAEVDDQVCGSCHSRGESAEGYHFPATYRPGEPLSDHFTFTTAEDDLWPDGSAKRNHQQYMDWQLDSSMALSLDTNCVTCHAVHDAGQADGQVRESLNDLCVQCHGEQEALARHTPFHQQALTKNEFTCADCHMPLMASTAEPFDLRVHSFLQPDPDGTLEHGGVEIMPNSCNLCHTGGAETPEWALQTIEHASSLAPESSFFGPGPTPTSPPPPTPMPSVGQAATLDLTPPMQWLRWGIYILIGLFVAIGVVVIVLWIRSRRNLNG